MPVINEQSVEPTFLLVSQKTSAGVKSSASLVERMVLASARAMELGLDPTSTQVECVAGQPDHVEGGHHRDHFRNLSRGAGLRPVNPSTILTPSHQAWGWVASQVLKDCFDRPSTIANNRLGPLPMLTGVRSMTTVMYLSPQRV